MGRVINPEPPGKRRKAYLKAIKRSIYEISNEEEHRVDRDKLAFVYFNLLGVGETITETTSAWENRDYWLKAEKFRQEWLWVDKYCRIIKKQIRASNEMAVQQSLSEVFLQLDKVDLPKRPLKRDSYEGLYKKFEEEFNESYDKQT